MSAVSTTSSPGSGVIALMQTYAAIIGRDQGSPPPSGTSNSSDSHDRDPATNVQLSDHVKTTLAQAKTDQALADRLQSLVEAHRAGNGGDGVSTATAQPSGNGGNSSTDVDKAFAQLSGEDAPTSTVTTNSAPIFTPVEPARSFTNTLQAGGYSISVTANARTGAFNTLVTSSDGSGAYDIRFGQSAGGGGSFGTHNILEGDFQTGNVEYVTVGGGEAAAASVTASSAAGTASTTVAAAQSNSVTFAIDFTTGSIETVQTQASFSSTTKQVGPPTPPLSILA
jgi:hypothetical protein